MHSFLRRSLLYVPSWDLHKINKAIKSSADTLIFDVEDGVPRSLKDQARNFIKDNIGAIAGRGELAIRVNWGDSSQIDNDLKFVNSMKKSLDSIVWPKVHSAHDARSIKEFTTGMDIHSLLTIESAAGLMNLERILEECPDASSLIVLILDLMHLVWSRRLLCVNGNREEQDGYRASLCTKQDC